MWGFSALFSLFYSCYLTLLCPGSLHSWCYFPSLMWLRFFHFETNSPTFLKTDLPLSQVLHFYQCFTSKWFLICVCFDKSLAWKNVNRNMSEWCSKQTRAIFFSLSANIQDRLERRTCRVSKIMFQLALRRMQERILSSNLWGLPHFSPRSSCSSWLQMAILCTFHLPESWLCCTCATAPLCVADKRWNLSAIHITASEHRVSLIFKSIVWRCTVFAHYRPFNR